MNRKTFLGCCASVALVALGITACSKAPAPGSPGRVDAASLRQIGTVDERFQSYNIEMVEVIGGRFWKPYSDIDALLKAQSSVAKSNKDAAGAPAGMDPNLYQQRPPIDLTNPRLRKLAAALGPAYVRVSGTWANTVYFQNSDQPPPKTPPKGFGGVLTRQQWKGVIDFAHAVDAKVVTSFATSAGTRGPAGVWTPDQARQLLDYTKSIGGSIAAAEYMNEPTYAEMGGAPKGYDAAAFGRDFSVFLPFVKKAAPDMLILGPGGVGEGIPLAPIGLAGSMIKTEDILKVTGPRFDGFSYHSYGATSKRCASMGPASQTTAHAALSEDFLSRADRIEAFYAGLRDTFEPGKALWLTETADAACGGNPWASTFLDSFRYLDQLGRMSKRGVQVHMHNTLASSDYGLLDDNTMTPRPNYWAALFWHKFMGTTVLDPGLSTASNLHVYSHCLRGQPGGLALLAINADPSASQSLDLAVAAERYTLTASSLDATSMQLNGSELKLGEDDAIPTLTGISTGSGRLTLPPATITFLAIPKANNASCH
jgi:heparanase 1